MCPVEIKLNIDCAEDDHHHVCLTLCHALRVVLAKIKELHEHYFGSLFVNNFPSFQNQIDPIMKQSVHTLSPNCKQITRKGGGRTTIQCRSDGWAEIIVLISRQHGFLKANKLPPLPCNSISSSFGAPKYDREFTDVTLVCEDG